MKSKLWTLPPPHYNGLLARCAPGMHEAVATLLRQQGITGGSVLDIAAGTGALLARLRDAGFSDLSAIELDTGAFALPGVTPLAADLNLDFASAVGRQFDLITAIEIIEHLDSPRHFLREAWKLLAPGGRLVLSTPNIAHWVGRVWFMARGELRNFKEMDYHHQRHISPINHTHVRLMLKEVGFELMDFRTAGSFYGPLKRLVTAPATVAFRLLCGPLASGDAVIYIAKRSEPDAASPGRDSTTYVSLHRPMEALRANRSAAVCANKERHASPATPAGAPPQAVAAEPPA